MNNIEIFNNKFIFSDEKGILIVKAWNYNSVRVYFSKNSRILKNDSGAILNKTKNKNIKVFEKDKIVTLINGELKVEFDGLKLVFYNNDKIILEEYLKIQNNVRRTIGIDEDKKIETVESSSLKIFPRNIIKKENNNKYKIVQFFESDKNEKIYGMGSYNEIELNKNLGMYELMHRNSQTSIPFYVSDKNYGFMWNNSSTGYVSFNKNYKKWVADNYDCIDYVVIVGKNMKEIISHYTEIVGRSPIINKNYLGLWQSKLRYQTTKELENIYYNYTKRKINLSVIVIDYYHWTEDGNYEFDNNYWAGIKELAIKLKENNTSIMVSVWPTVTEKSKYFKYYKENSMLLKKGNNEAKIFDNKYLLDFFNPKSKEFINNILNKNYISKDIELFWADQAEPEMDEYLHNEYNTYITRFDSVANKYPYEYLCSIDNNYPILIRSAWFNSQSKGALVWSGDIDSSFKSLKQQIQVLISMGLSGVSWNTCDIAGFHSGDTTTLEFKELLIRWFQFAVFTPILRMHGDRQPHNQSIGNSGGGLRTSGADNEIWSFGENVEIILKRYIKIRENLKEYIYNLYLDSNKFGYPISRSLFFEFPNDKKAWNETNNYMFGSELLICPITEYGLKKVKIYFPKGINWINVYTGKLYIGSKEYWIDIELENIPVFCKENSYLIKKLNYIFGD